LSHGKHQPQEKECIREEETMMMCLFVDVMRSYKNLVTPGELLRDTLPTYNSKQKSANLESKQGNTHR
jgi:hypothetical protein